MDVRRITDDKFVPLTAQENPILLDMAKYALNNLVPEIEKVDNKFRVSTVYYFVKNAQTVIFKFEISTSYGLLTYYFEVVRNQAPVQTIIQDVNVHESVTRSTPVLTK